VIEQFQPADLIEPWVQDPEAAPPAPLSGDWRVSAVSLLDDSDARLVDSASFTAGLNDHVAIVGSSSSGKEHLGMLLAGLVSPSSGDIKVGELNLADQPSAVTGRRLAYVGQDAYLFPQSVRENLTYGMKHRPVTPPAEVDPAMKAREDSESLKAGNTTLDPAADWIDYQIAGVSGPDEMTDRLIEVLKLVEMEDDVYRFGLGGAIDPEARPDEAEDVLKARDALRERLEAQDAADLVIRFDPERYNPNATLAENLLFGTPIKATYAPEVLGDNELVMELLEQEGLTGALLDMGLSIARTMVEIFADLPPGHPFFEQFSFIEADELPDFRVLVQRSEKGGAGALPKEDQRRLMALPFKYVEARHRLGLIDEKVEERVVATRAKIAQRIEEADPGAVEAYRPEAYNSAASLQDNILFGRLAFGQAEAEKTVGRVLGDVLNDLGLRRTVLEVGLDYQVGVGGKRLTKTQRQKLAIARALLKRADVLILNEAAGVMDGATQSLLFDRILEDRKGQGVIWTLQRANFAQRFDQVLVMQAGRIVEQGKYAELESADSALKELISAG